MRLITDRNPGAFAVYVKCLSCGKRVELSEAQIDLDGPAFQAYYHRGCVPVGEDLAPYGRTAEYWK